ncbi:hypothetical protein MARI151_20368 [Maribacter litoralis]|uniref:Uncharacterized protein n=1 Tax=Maribacter litoralis TaxID=2059726 RepID=A0A653PWX9_9FLAO|nr:hypothetical protein MARI151_20368 [Maribacter litoralis]
MALVFLIIATSVLNRNDFIDCPNTRIPEHWDMTSGTVTILFLSLLPNTGMLRSIILKISILI